MQIETTNRYPLVIAQDRSISETIYSLTCPVGVVSLTIKLGMPTVLLNGRFDALYHIHCEPPREAWEWKSWKRVHADDGLVALKRAIDNAIAELTVLCRDIGYNPDDRSEEAKVPQNAGLRLALDAYERMDYESAFRLILPLAEEGLHCAQTVLGGLYYVGNGVEQSASKAREWYEHAAAGCDAHAADNLASMYRLGVGGAMSHQRCIDLKAVARTFGMSR